jgi:hypothetical protein
VSWSAAWSTAIGSAIGWAVFAGCAWVWAKLILFPKWAEHQLSNQKLIESNNRLASVMEAKPLTREEVRADVP